MPLVTTCHQNIIFQPAISLQLSIVENATYTIQLSMVGINGITGFGSWTASFQGLLNDDGVPINSEVALVGTGSYQGIRNPSISSLLVNLKIRVAYPSQLPLETPDPTETSWKGIVNLTSGSVLGILNSQDGQIGQPIYTIRGTYRLQYDEETRGLYVTNLKIF